MKSTTIAIRTEQNTKQQAQAIFKDMGLDMSTAINLFLNETIHERKLPFQPSLTPFEQAVFNADGEPGIAVKNLGEFKKLLRDA